MTFEPNLDNCLCRNILEYFIIELRKVEVAYVDRNLKSQEFYIARLIQHDLHCGFCYANTFHE